MNTGKTIRTLGAVFAFCTALCYTAILIHDYHDYQALDDGALKTAIAVIANNRWMGVATTLLWIACSLIWFYRYYLPVQRASKH